MTLVEEIRKTVKTIRESDESPYVLRKKYAIFAEKHPRLFEFCLDKTIDMSFLEMMLVQLGNLCENKIDVNKADEVVIGNLRKVYLDPVLEKSS